MHYDPPPPLTLADVEEMRRRGEFRAANRLRAYIDVDDGRIVGAGYTGRPLMGLTPITVGALRIMLPAKANRDIQWQPEVRAGEATFVQTAGGRPGFSFLKPTWRWPFLVTKPFTIWTTVRLTIRVDGTPLGFGNAQIADFAPDGTTFAAQVVPEPTSIALMLISIPLVVLGARRRFS